MAYPDRTKTDALALLAANGGNVRKTARELQMPVSTLRLWKHLADGELAGDIAERQHALADSLEMLAYRCVEVLPEKLEEASAREAATVLGICLDKVALLRSTLPASPVKEKIGSPDETYNRILELLGEGAPPQERVDRSDGAAGGATA